MKRPSLRIRLIFSVLGFHIIWTYFTCPYGEKKKHLEKVLKVEAPEKELGRSQSEQANQISSLAVEPVDNLHLSPLSPHRTPVGPLIFRLIAKESDGMI